MFALFELINNIPNRCSNIYIKNSMYAIVKATVKIESLKISFYLLKAFKSKSTLRFNLNRCFYYNIHAIILITGLLGVLPPSVLLAFSQSYVKHDLRKNKIVVLFFSNRLIFMS